jgi:dephospho-CoA kinase
LNDYCYIAEKANVGLGKTTVDKIIGEAGFKLIISRKMVRVRPGEELEDKNLKPTFKSGRTNVGLFAAIVNRADLYEKMDAEGENKRKG